MDQGVLCRKWVIFGTKMTYFQAGVPLRVKVTLRPSNAKRLYMDE